jgi:hypothetical protein
MRVVGLIALLLALTVVDGTVHHRFLKGAHGSRGGNVAVHTNTSVAVHSRKDARCVILNVLDYRRVHNIFKHLDGCRLPLQVLFIVQILTLLLTILSVLIFLWKVCFQSALKSGKCKIIDDKKSGKTHITFLLDKRTVEAALVKRKTDGFFGDVQVFHEVFMDSKRV